MPAPWVVPVASAILSAGGQFFQNQFNRGMSREQMAFQERMRNTAVQASVDDYRKAGLNPALAYDRSAAAPGGASAVMGDPIGAGVSSAKAAAALAQEMRQAREAHAEDQKIRQATSAKLRVEAQNAIHQGDLLTQQWKFNNLSQPADLRTRNATALLQEYALPGAKNTARFEERLHDAAIGGSGNASLAAKMIQLFRGITK